MRPYGRLVFFFFNDTATTEIYPLSLHDALPIFVAQAAATGSRFTSRPSHWDVIRVISRCLIYSAYLGGRDRKSTRLNSSHSQISYAVFCLKKKKENKHIH